jgi:hypothetical protein
MIPPPQMQAQEQPSEHVGGSGTPFGSEVCQQHCACALGPGMPLLSQRKLPVQPSYSMVQSPRVPVWQPQGQGQPSTGQHQ